eukprot:GEMP01009155.1.p1 GENE.GEMP01009155.1~~GEMP01009155.1.p1  ORF type:complete len:651 (+),score=146.15 GEMP01009155.1:143-2095(+)
MPSPPSGPTQGLTLSAADLQFLHASFLKRPAMLESLDSVLERAIVEGKLAVVELLFEIGLVPKAVDGEGQSWLHFSVLEATEKKAATTQLLLDRGVDINAGNTAGRTALSLAAQLGDSAIVSLLLEKGALVTTDKEGNNPLHQMSTGRTDGHLECVNHLIQAKCSVNNANEGDGRTLLHMAADEGNEVMCRALIEQHGANVLELDPDGNMAIHWVCGPTSVQFTEGHEEVVTLLLTKHPSLVSTTGEKKKTPLHFACDEGHISAVKLLLEHKGDPKELDDDGMTCLHWAAAPSSDQGVTESTLAIVEHLISNKCDVDIRDFEEKTPLYWAASKGHNDVMEIFVKHKADLNARDSKDTTALHAASAHNAEGQATTVKSLIEHRANIEQKDSRLRTALHFAVEFGTLDTATMLLELKAPLEATALRPRGDDGGWTPLHFACVRATSDVEGGDSKQMVVLLLARKANIEAKTTLGNQPLHLAAEQGLPSTVTHLLEHGADVNAIDDSGCTVLHWACAPGAIGATPGHIDSIMSLLFFKANLETRDTGRGRTPLLFAADEGYSDVCRVLLEQKADVTATDSDGFTALHWACAPNVTEQGGDEDHLGTIKILLDHRADIEAQGTDGKTPLQYAQEEGHTAVLKLLETNTPAVNAG